MATSTIKRMPTITNINHDTALLDLNAPTSVVSLVNGWASSKQNYPSDFGNYMGAIITVWSYTNTPTVFTPNGTGLIQILVREDGKMYSRYKTGDTWGTWRSATS